MLSNLAMRASRVTVRLPSDLSRLGRARAAPASAKPHAMRRVAAFANWRMGGGGGAPADDAPPPPRPREDRGARGRFDDDDGYVERYGEEDDFGSDREPRSVGFAARRSRARGRDGHSRDGETGGPSRRGSRRRGDTNGFRPYLLRKWHGEWQTSGAVSVMVACTLGLPLPRKRSNSRSKKAACFFMSTWACTRPLMPVRKPLSGDPAAMPTAAESHKESLPFPWTRETALRRLLLVVVVGVNFSTENRRPALTAVLVDGVFGASILPRKKVNRSGSLPLPTRESLFEGGFSRV